MSWKFDEKSPIYVQIAQHIKMQIISQEIKSGDQLPTVRELAEEAGVTVIAGGHYQTETVGVNLVRAKLEKEKHIETVFIDIPTAL